MVLFVTETGVLELHQPNELVGSGEILNLSPSTYIHIHARTLIPVFNNEASKVNGSKTHPLSLFLYFLTLHEAQQSGTTQ